MSDGEYRVLIEGRASGELLLLEEPLSLWGGLDPETGLIVDRNHPQLGRSMMGRIVAMAHGRGSSSSSSVLAEALRLGTGPAGFILQQPDAILVIGALVAERLYSTVCPIVCGVITGELRGRWLIDGESVLPIQDHGSNGPSHQSSG